MYAPFCRTKHPPIEEWERDLKQMKALGYTCLHGFAEWHDIEYEKGQFDFTKIDHLIECAHSAGLVTVINVATQNSVGFYSPRWLMEELRESEGFVDARGNRPHHSEYVVPCLDDPVYNGYAKRFLTELARHFAADTRIGGYVLWGEPTLNSPFSAGERICYCKHTTKKFREYLKKTYRGSISALCEKWGSEGPAGYSSFDEIYPPTGYSRQRGGYASWDDFCEFMEQNLAGHISEADRIFKENGATQPTVTEMLPGIANTVDSWKLAKTTDIVGISLFGKPTRMTPLYMSMSQSLAKAEGKSSFVIEAGGGSIKFDNPAGYAPQAFTPSADELKTTVLMRAGFGARGVMFWCWRPRLSDMEGNDFGMCRPDGKPLRRTHELGRLSQRMYELSDVYASGSKKSDVAIFCSQKINHLARADRMDGNYHDALKGAGMMMTDLRINYDFISDEQILLGALAKYKVLLLPSSYVISAECADRIGEFVRSGGRVIADYILAEKEPGGFCYTSLPGGGLDKVFGIEREDVLYIAHPSMLEENSLGIDVGSFVEEIISVGAMEIEKRFRDTYPTLTENSYGKGRANYISTQYFPKYSSTPTKTARERILKLLNQSGVCSEVRIEEDDRLDTPKLICSALSSEDGSPRVITVTNVTYDKICDKMTLPKGSYLSVDDSSRLKITNARENTTVEFELAALESFAIYAED